MNGSLKQMRHLLLLSLVLWRTPAIANSQVEFHTTLGKCQAELFDDKAPEIVNHFLSLVNGSKPWRHPLTGQTMQIPFYENLSFFRVMPGFLAVTGDILGNGLGDAGLHLLAQTSTNFDEAGILGFATHENGTISSQVFITLKPTKALNNRFAALGRFETNCAIITKLNQLQVNKEFQPLKPVLLKSIHVINLRAEK